MQADIAEKSQIQFSIPHVQLKLYAFMQTDKQTDIITITSLEGAREIIFIYFPYSYFIFKVIFITAL